MTGRRGKWRNYAGEFILLPDYPFMIIVPPTLVEQVALECHRFLQTGSFNIIKVTKSMDQHCDVWRQTEMQSEVPSHMTIYIATTVVSV